MTTSISPSLPMCDGHNDALLRLWLNGASDPAAAFVQGTPDGHLDLPRCLRGGFAGGLFAAFVPPPSYLARARLCRSVADIRRCIAQGTIAMVMHLEGADALDMSLSLLEELHTAGCAASARFGIGVMLSAPASRGAFPNLPPLAPA